MERRAVRLTSELCGTACGQALLLLLLPSVSRNQSFSSQAAQCVRCRSAFSRAGTNMRPSLRTALDSRRRPSVLCKKEIRIAFNKSLYFACKIVLMQTGIIILVLSCSHIFSELPDEKSSRSDILLQSCSLLGKGVSAPLPGTGGAIMKFSVRNSTRHYRPRTLQRSIMHARQLTVSLKVFRNCVSKELEFMLCSTAPVPG